MPSQIAQRLKGITKIPDRYRFEELPPPKSVKIEIVPRCNYRCQYCTFTLRKTQPQKDMDWELFKRITTEMKTLGVEEIGPFYIGESFVNPELLIKAIRFLKQDLKIPYVFLTSNASLADPRYVKECMEAGLDSLKWSCNAADEEQFIELMGVSPKFFNLAKENIKSAYKIREKNGYKTGLYASSVKYNDAQIYKMESLIRYVKPYVDEHYWLPLYTAGGMAKEKEKKLNMLPVAGNPGRLDDPAEPLPCWTMFTASHIMYDGKMTACCLDGTGRWVMGDLKTQSFMEAWNSEAFKKLRKASLAKDVRGTLCERCVLTEETETY